MSVKLLTEYRLEFVGLKADCTGSSESTLVKMPYCWKSHVAAQFMRKWADAYNTLGTFISQRKGKIQTSTTNLVFHACSSPFHARVHWNCFLFSCKPMKRRHIWAIMFCVLSPLSRAKAAACYPSLKTTTTRGLIVGIFDLKHVREPLPRPFVCGWYY